jgi:hypothetical protein
MPKKYCPECGNKIVYGPGMREEAGTFGMFGRGIPAKPKKRKLSAWNKYVKANSNKPRFRYARSNKINLKKMAIAFRKTPAGRKKRR